MRVAGIQFACEESKDRNLRKAEELVERGEDVPELREQAGINAFYRVREQA